MRLARIAGQVNGIQKMVDSDRYCVDILTQINAVRSAVNQLGVIMLSTHLEKCVNSRDHECSDKPVPAEERQGEIRSTLKQFLDFQ